LLNDKQNIRSVLHFDHFKHLIESSLCCLTEWPNDRVGQSNWSSSELLDEEMEHGHIKKPQRDLVYRRSSRQDMPEAGEVWVAGTWIENDKIRPTGEA
jgi:hypothetical protein